MLNHQVYQRRIKNYSIILSQDYCLQEKLPDQTYKLVLYTYSQEWNYQRTITRTDTCFEYRYIVCEQGTDVYDITSKR